MKKFIHLVLLFALVMMFSGSQIALAQEPTAEPAQEPTAEPAQEPTAEPTTQPTAEPTTQPTAEPTTQPTAEPTTQPTAEPTTQPTAEPTTQPTAEPTTQPTAEPTTETPAATIDPLLTIASSGNPSVVGQVVTFTVTVSGSLGIPTGNVTFVIDEVAQSPVVALVGDQAVFTTSTLLEGNHPVSADYSGDTVYNPAIVSLDGGQTVGPAVEVAGEISAAAVPGSWSSEYIVIQNLGSSTASANLALYQNSASPVQTIAKSIPGNGSVTVAGSEITNNGQFSGIISSDQPVAAGVINTNNTSKLGDAYAGFSTPSNKQTIPLIFRGHASFKTTFYIQNAESTQQIVTIKTIKQGTSAEAPVGGVQRTIPGNSTVAVDFTGSEFDAFGSGNGAFGFAIIQGQGSSKVAALAENVLDLAGQYQAAFVIGLNDDAGGTNLVAPLMYNSHASFNTGLNIINLTGTATTVRLTFNADAVVYPSVGTKTHDVSLPGNGVANINMAALKAQGIIPTSFGGGTISTNPAVNIVAVVNTNKTVGGAFAFASPPINPALATGNAAAPVALQLGTGGVFNSGINVFSPNGATSVQAKWVLANTNPPETYTINQTITNGVANFNAAQLRATGQLPNKTFIGSVYLTFSGGSGIAVVNNDNSAGGLSTQMLGVNY